MLVVDGTKSNAIKLKPGQNVFHQSYNCIPSIVVLSIWVVLLKLLTPKNV